MPGNRGSAKRSEDDARCHRDRARGVEAGDLHERLGRRAERAERTGGVMPHARHARLPALFPGRMQMLLRLGRITRAEVRDRLARMLLQPVVAVRHDSEEAQKEREREMPATAQEKHRARKVRGREGGVKERKGDKGEA